MTSRLRQMWQLSEDMNRLADLGTTWGMKFHPDKCETVTIPRKRKPTVRGQGLLKVSEATNLAVTISSNKSGIHISTTV